jgi:hypothetical protein
MNPVFLSGRKKNPFFQKDFTLKVPMYFSCFVNLELLGAKPWKAVLNQWA